MEDAMVINRGSLQRGFAHGQVYKSETIDLKEIVKKCTSLVIRRSIFLKTSPESQSLLFF